MPIGGDIPFRLYLPELWVVRLALTSFSFFLKAGAPNKKTTDYRPPPQAAAAVACGYLQYTGPFPVSRGSVCPLRDEARLLIDVSRAIETTQRPHGRHHQLCTAVNSARCVH
jgi:hypothetical protein